MFSILFQNNSKGSDELNQIYQNKQFKVYRVDDCFILHNSSKEFVDGHTHLDSLKQCKLIIQLSLERRIPKHLSRYLLISLYRVNEGEYANKVLDFANNKKKKPVYVNRH